MAYIDKNIACDLLEKKALEEQQVDECAELTTQECLSIVRAIPTAEVEEVRHGKWLPQVVLGVNTWDCSECKTIGSPHWKRCPICEAKMDGGKEE